jgi:hypothetical protein
MIQSPGHTIVQVYANKTGIDDTNWHMFTIEVDPTTAYLPVKVWIDNVLEAQKNFSSTSFSTANPTIGGGQASAVSIGHSFESSSGPGFGGMLDEASFWNRLLTPDEISTLYNNNAGYSLISPPSSSSFVKSIDNNANVTLYTNTGTISSLTSVPLSSLSTTGMPSGMVFPFGVYSWSITHLLPVQRYDVTMHYPSAISSNAGYWKFQGSKWINPCSTTYCIVNNKNLTITETADTTGTISESGGIGVMPVPTTTTLSSSPNPSVPGKTTTYVATVTPNTATGTVTFSVDGTGKTYVATLSGGQASFSTKSQGVGKHSVTATYSGDMYDLGSSATLTENVNQATTTTSVSSSQNPSISGQPVSCTAALALQLQYQAALPLQQVSLHSQ